MQIDAGLVIVIIAVLIFYLRLIVLQRERARQVNRQQLTPVKKKGKSGRAAPAQPAPMPQFSIVSRNWRDWVIAGIGVVLILIGILMSRGTIPYSWAQPNWWLPVAVGILAFSWGFK